MTNQEKPARLLVLGLGNVLCGDDGLGVAAVESFRRRYDTPENVYVLDGGTLGLSLLGYLQEADDVILVDAINDDAPPGSFVRLEGEDVAPAVETRLSVHQIGVADLLDAARWLDSYPRRLALLGLVPRTLRLGVGTSTAVGRQLPLLVEELADEVVRMGYELHPKQTHETTSDADRSPAVRALGL